MTTPSIHGLNLNALVALDALLSECNVTRAAKRVGITQPAMSQTLARLREQFDDPILVRSGRGMKRSPRAEAMLEPLAEALQAVERAVQIGMRFDAKSSTRVFRVAVTDLQLTLVLPGVLRELANKAPGIRIQAARSPSDGSPRSWRRAASISRWGIRSARGRISTTEVLFEDEYVCLVCEGHPLTKRKRVRFSDYKKHHHIAHTPVEYVPDAMVERGFAARSGIRASLPYLLAVPGIVRNTELVATVPRSVLSAPVDLTGIAVVDAPTEMPPVVQSMWWHPRFDRDPGHSWFREVVRGVAGEVVTG